MVTKLRSMQKIERKKVRVYETKWMATKLRSIQKLKGKNVKDYGTKWMATKLRLMQEQSYPKTQLNDGGTTVYISSLNNG